MYMESLSKSEPSLAHYRTYTSPAYRNTWPKKTTYSVHHFGITSYASYIRIRNLCFLPYLVCVLRRRRGASGYRVSRVSCGAPQEKNARPPYSQSIIKVCDQNVIELCNTEKLSTAECVRAPRQISIENPDSWFWPMAPASCWCASFLLLDSFRNWIFFSSRLSYNMTWSPNTLLWGRIGLRVCDTFEWVFGADAALGWTCGPRHACSISPHACITHKLKKSQLIERAKSRCVCVRAPYTLFWSLFVRIPSEFGACAPCVCDTSPIYTFRQKSSITFQIGSIHGCVCARHLKTSWLSHCALGLMAARCRRFFLNTCKYKSYLVTHYYLAPLNSPMHYLQVDAAQRDTRRISSAAYATRCADNIYAARGVSQRSIASVERAETPIWKDLSQPRSNKPQTQNRAIYQMTTKNWTS